MHQVGWTRPALSDLRAIGDYVRQHDSEAALRTLRAIRSKSDLLAKFPAIGPAVSTKYRSLVVRNTPYVILYRVMPDTVQILRVRHQAENWREDGT